MSIICYTGLPGDGKSYSAVENVVIAALRDGRHVAHNLMLNEAALRVVCDRDVRPLLHQIDRDDTPEQLIAKCPLGAVVVIDEVWRYWPAGIKANEVPKAQLAFFKEHRHRAGEDGISTEILIIDQDPRTGIPAFLRALIELTYVHTKLAKVGAKGRFRVDVYSRCQSAEKPSKGALIRKLQGKYRPEVWNCYISHTQAKRLGEAGLEKAVDDRASLLKSWTFRAAVVAACLLPLIVFGAIRSVHGMVANGGRKHDLTVADFDGTEHYVAPGWRRVRKDGSVEDAKPAPVALPAEDQAAALSDPRAQNLSAPRKTAFDEPRSVSGTWRVLGGIARADGTGVVVLSSATGRRRIDAKTCTLEEHGDWTCPVEDGIATMWSGARSPNPLSASQAENVGKDAPPLPGTAQAQGT